LYELPSKTYHLRKKYKRERQQLLDDVKEKKIYWNWDEEAITAICGELAFEKGVVLSQDTLRN
jgi:hypothetical protein